MALLRALASGTSAASAAAASAPSVFWLGNQTSTVSLVTRAVQFMGSIVAWFRNGA
jgi:hypothetical protein